MQLQWLKGLSPTMRPVLLLEINEVPWRLIDLFKADARYCALDRFFRESSTFTNVAVDRENSRLGSRGPRSIAG